MKLINILNEIKVKQLLIVDIQPAHKTYISNSLLNNFVSYLNTNSFGNITFLYNGRDLGYSDSENSLQDWLIYDLGVNEDVVYDIDFVEKSYGFFRGAMGISIDEDDIVKTAQYLIKNKKYDSRDLEEEEFIKNNLPIELYNNEDGIYLPDIINDLKHVNNATLIGGGKDECLLEIELLLQSMKKKYKLDKSLIY